MAQSTDNFLQLTLDIAACNQTLRAESQEAIRLSRLSAVDMQRTINHSRTLIRETRRWLALLRRPPELSKAV